MTNTHDIIAVETDSKQDCGFTVAFERSYLLSEQWPITEQAAIKAVEDAYDWIPRLDDIVALDDGQKVGELVVEDREYMETRCTL